MVKGVCLGFLEYTDRAGYDSGLEAFESK